jgi:DNA repair protein RecN (Recombination protein N)
MLHSLYIRDFAIVKTLELELERGLTVLTGETGAGKSILIDALALALGGRADVGVVRQGSARAEVSAHFALDESEGPGKTGAAAARRWLKQHDLDADGECVLRRVVESERASKAFINGRPVPVQMLRELGEYLIDIHGQHEHQSLLKRDAQREILDDYAKLNEAVADIAERYRALRALQDRVHALRQQSADRGTRLELLRHQVAELDALNLKPDDMPALENEYARLAHAAELMEGAQAAVQVLYDDDEGAVSQLLGRIVAKLEGLAPHDPQLGETAALLNQAIVHVDEAAGELHRYLDGLELDPERLQSLETRIGAIHDLTRKHRVAPEELPALRERLRTELGDVENFDDNLARLTDEAATARAAYLQAAKQISKARVEASKKLGHTVTERMQELGMAGGRFTADVVALPEDELGPYGLERIEFQVAANAGQAPRPLAKVASGGELSRISLALQVVIAGNGRIPTLIFDEVDVGVGGRVAEIVGQQLRALGKARQVLCITHLPQVAALGQHHLQASKHAHGGVTLAEVRALSAKDRVLEIARMLGGVEVSKKTIAHAEDMLSRATA